jgi:glutamine amidotransferase
LTAFFFHVKIPHILRGAEAMIAIIDYGMGNITSIRNGFTYVGINTVLTDDIGVLERYRAIVLPGVGAFGSAMDELQRKGLVAYLKERQKDGAIILGICLGLQLLFPRSEEDPGIPGLGFLPGEVVRFPQRVKVPQMGWNRVFFSGREPLAAGIPEGSHFYFANSYYASLQEKEYLLAWSNYEVAFPAAVRKENVYGLQFHPEKSGEAGLRLLYNFGKVVKDAGYTGY